MPNARKVADVYVVLMNRYAAEFGITTRLRWIHYLSQVAHESCELKYNKEIASGKAYEGRKDLGNTQKGDGVKFKGRGLIQITGRKNYTDYGDYLREKGMVVDLKNNPELLEKHPGDVKSSMWFFATHGCLVLADRDDFLGVTKKVNGGTNGLKSRQKYYERAKAVL